MMNSIGLTKTMLASAGSTRLVCAVACFAVTVSGCGGGHITETSSSTPIGADTKTSADSRNVATLTSNATKESGKSIEPHESLDVDDGGVDSASAANALPYPERSDPFLRPSPREAAAIAQETPARQVRGGSPELKGFVNVNGIGAMLLFEGQIWIAREGDERGKVKVLAVDPPEVTLARGEDEWNLSLVPKAKETPPAADMLRIRG